MKMQHSLANGRQHNTHTHKWSVRELCAAPGRHATPCHVRYALGHFASANIQTHWTHTYRTHRMHDTTSTCTQHRRCRPKQSRKCQRPDTKFRLELPPARPSVRPYRRHRWICVRLPPQSPARPPATTRHPVHVHVRVAPQMQSGGGEILTGVCARAQQANTQQKRTHAHTHTHNELAIRMHARI